MLTVDEVSAVPLFSALPASNLERLARTSADIHLGPGEFAVHEGGEPALFAVLSGKIEVVKLIDGIERRLGWRVPGTIFGEVPIALGSPFPGGYRAVEPSRVMRVELQEYYTIAAASKDVSLKVSALARERLGGLQSINAEPHRPRVTLVGHRWDTDASALRRFLARNQISFHSFTPDAPELPTHWPGPLPTGDLGPAVRLADGEVIVAPDIRDLAHRLGLQTMPRVAEYDVAIIGGGPAALRLRSTAPRKGCAQSLLSAKLREDKPERPHALRIISDFQVAFRVTSWLVAPCSKQSAWVRRFSSPGRSRASVHRHGKLLSTTATSLRLEPSFSQPA